MSMGDKAGNSFQAAMAMLEHLAKLPAPEVVLKELKRFNDNMERIQPDMSKMANALCALDLKDVKNLNTTLQGFDVNKMVLTVNDANNTMKQLYERLWGRK